MVSAPLNFCCPYAYVKEHLKSSLKIMDKEIMALTVLVIRKNDNSIGHVVSCKSALIRIP